MESLSPEDPLNEKDLETHAQLPNITRNPQISPLLKLYLKGTP
jgi:hypothetical protein